MTNWRASADIYCGLMLLMFSAFGIWVNSDLEFGRAQDMGPAYFPIMISCVLGGLSLIMILRGLIAPSDELGKFDLRPIIFILLSFVAFAILIDRAGLLAAVVAQVGIAHFACRGAKALESALIGLGTAVFSALVFVYLLKLPVRLLP